MRDFTRYYADFSRLVRVLNYKDEAQRYTLERGLPTELLNAAGCQGAPVSETLAEYIAHLKRLEDNMRCVKALARPAAGGNPALTPTPHSQRRPPPHRHQPLRAILSRLNRRLRHLGGTVGSELGTTPVRPDRGGSVELLFSDDRREAAPRRRIQGGGFPSNPSSSRKNLGTDHGTFEQTNISKDHRTNIPLNPHKQTALHLGNETLKLSLCTFSL